MTSQKYINVNSDRGLSQIWSVLKAKAGSVAERTPLRFLIITAVSVFVAEALIMIVLESIPPFSFWATVFLDASLILLITLPALYVWLYRPMIRNISERIKAQRDVGESKERLSSHLQNTPIAVIEWNLDFEVIEWNSAAERVFGYTKDEALGRHACGLLVPKSARDQVNQVWNDLLENTGGLCSTNENLAKDGRTIVCEWSNTPIVDESGSVCGVASLVQDITERRLAEEALQASEERFRTQMVQSPLVMEIYDLDGLQIEVNKAYEELWGFPASTTVNKFNVLESKEVEETGLMDYVKRAYGGEAVIIPDYAFDPTGETESGGAGRTRWLRTQIYPLRDSSGEVISIVISHEDITERKENEKAMRKNEELLKIVMDNLPIGVAVNSADPASTFEYMNDNFAKNYHTTLEAMAGPKGFWESVYEDPVFREEIKQRVVDDCASGDPDRMYWANVPLTRKGDQTYYITARNTPVPGRQLMISTVWDVTEQKNAQEELALKNLVFESSLTANSTADNNGVITHVNDAFLRIWGYESKESAIGQLMASFFEYEHEAVKTLSVLDNDGEWEGEFTAVRKDGTTFFAYAFSTVVKNHTGERIGYQSIVMDITETKRLRELKSRAERLETAGTIAGQVAHDFNNLLAPLLAYPDFIREDLPPNHPGLRYLDDIENSAKKIADINQQLLSLGRRGHYNLEVLNLNVIVDQAAREITSTSTGLSLEKDLEKDLLNILGGGSQIHRAISNLLFNAYDALEGPGKITIKTENYYVDDVSVAYGRVPTGEYVKLTIADTGQGIPDEIVQKIFDPFFTSKTTDKKRGSGLGLSVVDAVVKDHGGYLDLQTQVGKGTTFYIYFPTTRDSVDEKQKEKLVGGSEKVLVVDDDLVQRDVSSKLLTKLGYEVNTSDSGEAAIEFLKGNAQDILILDMVMPPGIDGAETYRQIQEICPGQKAIIVSGFSESERVIEAQNLGAGAFVKKPLTNQAIALAVRTELDRTEKLITSQ